MLHNTRTADTAALTVDGAQPVWMTLNDARERAFTGELIFEADPEVLAYLDNGIVYYAERATDVSLGRRLLDAGVIDIGQVERGTVRVGDIEHLGRLFDRDPSVDRDAVAVLTETSTHDLIAELANRAITTVRVTAYRHHPSGVHRWFVAPLDAAAMSRPVSAVAQLDTAVVDELPGLSFAGTDADEFTIEWDDQIGETDPFTGTPFTGTPFTGTPFTGTPFTGTPLTGTPVAVFDEQFDLANVEAAQVIETVDETVDTEPEPGSEIDTNADTDSDLAGFEFAVVWPDGSEELAISATVDTNHTNDTAVTAVTADASQPMPVVGLAPPGAVAPIFTQSDGGDLRFELPPLTISDDPEAADADVPDDVAVAVRRAIAAIEAAMAATHEFAPRPDVITELPEIVEVAPIDEFDSVDVADTADTAWPAGLDRFAPPTMATSAEVLYAQMADDGPSVDAAAVAAAVAAAAAVAVAVAAPTLAGSPAGGVASVVFVDEPVAAEPDGGIERSSALRRLIVSLRRKDH